VFGLPLVVLALAAGALGVLGYVGEARAGATHTHAVLTALGGAQAADAEAVQRGAVRTALGAVRTEELRRSAERHADQTRLSRLAIAGLGLGAVGAALLAALTRAMLAGHARRQAAQDATLREQHARLARQAAELEAQAQQLAEQREDMARATARLAASEAHARLLVDTVPSGLVESDARGHFVWANAAAERILRLPRAEITARDYAAPAWRTVTLDGAPLGPEALPVGRALATGEPVRAFEHAILDPATGERVALRVNVAPLRDADGRVVGALSAFDDVTAELHAQARLRRVEESGVVGLFSWTLAGGIVEANDAFLGMLGYTRADLAAGRVDWRQMTPPEYAASDEVAVAELLATGAHGPLRKAYVGRDGRAVPIVLASAFLPGSREDGVCVCLDLRALADVEAAERRAREGAERLLAVTAGFSGALTPREVAEVLAARGGAAAGAHATAVTLAAGDAVDEAEGRTPRGAPAELELLAAAGLDATEAAAWARVPLDASIPTADAARTGAPVWLPDPAARAAAYPALAAVDPAPGARGDRGRRAWCALPLTATARAGADAADPARATAAPAPRVLGAVAFAFAEPQPFDAAQRGLLAALAGQAAQALERARLYREARAGDEAKSGFMATMSHELRTPLNALIGYSELLLMGVPDPIPVGAQAQVTRMRTAARHLLGLIEEILLHAQLEAGRVLVRAERVDADALVDEVRTVIEPLAQARGLALAVDDGGPRRSGDRGDGDPAGTPGRPVVLRTDPGKLRQILINLAGNAVKFTDRGAVTLRMRAADGRVTFAVEDTGSGSRRRTWSASSSRSGRWRRTRARTARRAPDSASV
jgi:PAS domain S-box-containing protein